jgi:glyoxylase-like metal-dependent hydrolase (beta-lactamase superfamily II)
VYSVTILSNGEWIAPGTVIYSHAFGRHDPVKIAQNFYLLRGNGQTILVDTGIDGIDAYVSAEQRESLGIGPCRSTIEALASVGVRPDDVDTLVLTHLHFDHYINARLFTRARIIVNRRDWHHVMDPANRRYAPRLGFPREVFAWLTDEAWERLELVDGETEVLPGVTTIWTGGHSPGHQMVIVETGEGRVVIPGDEIYMYENLGADIPIGYYYDFERLVAAMDRIRELGGFVLPAHDPLVPVRHPSLQIG